MNQDGVVLACDCDPGQLTYTQRPNSHEEWVYEREVAVERLRVVACIREGENVFAAPAFRREVPPLAPDTLARIQAVDRNAELVIPGVLGADLRAAGATPVDPKENPWL